MHEVYYLVEFRSAVLPQNDSYDANVAGACRNVTPENATGVVVWHVETTAPPSPGKYPTTKIVPTARKANGKYVNVSSVYMNGTPDFVRAEGGVWRPGMQTPVYPFPVGQSTNYLYARDAAGFTHEYQHLDGNIDGNIDGKRKLPTKNWAEPRRVANWARFKTVIPGGGDRYYGIEPGGNLYWLENRGEQGLTALNFWREKHAGDSWQSFSRVFGGSNGVIYAVSGYTGNCGSAGVFTQKPNCVDDGILYWYKDRAFDKGGGDWGAGRTTVGRGWGITKFKHVFSAGRGVIYVIDHTGDLYHYRHLGYESGSDKWTKRVKVGHGWHEFKQVFGAGNGVIYAIKENGTLSWYRHNTWNALEPNYDWSGPVEVGNGWNFRSVIGRLPDTTPPPLG